MMPLRSRTVSFGVTSALGWTFAIVGLIAATSAPIAAQGRGGPPAGGASDTATTDPLTGPLVTGAPFSADASTTVTQTLADGTRITQQTTAKFFRDSAGRVRREETIIGMDALNPGGDPQTVITIVGVPRENVAYVLDPVTHTARRIPSGFVNLRLNGSTNWTLTPSVRIAGATASFGSNLGVPQRGLPSGVQTTEEQLAPRQIEGVVRATGRRITTTIAVDKIGNDRPIQIVDERWESAELKMMIASRFSDPRTAVIDYKLTNINRAEPRADLFAVPQDYTVIDTPTLNSFFGGRRGGGQRGEGQRGDGQRGTGRQ